MARRRRGTALLAVAVALAAVGVAGCGDEDFENEPRPPVVLPVSASIADDSIVVSPATFGAGTARFTIVNLGDSSSVFSIDGPTTAESVEIAPGTSAEMNAEVVTGEYEALAEGLDAPPFAFEVGAERESSQNELLLP